MIHNMQLSNYLAKNPKKYLIFDFDETLFKLHLPWDIFRKKLHRFFVKIDPRLYEKLHQRMSSFSMTNHFIKKHGVVVLQKNLRMSGEFESKLLTGVSTNPKLINWVKNNADQYELFIWSSNIKTTIEKILAEHELSGVFEQVVAKDSVNFFKPDPDGFAQILAKAQETDEQAQLDEFLMIGDSAADEGAAKAVGIDFFLVDFFKSI